MALNSVPIAGSTYKNLAEVDRRLINQLFSKRSGVLEGFVLTPAAEMNGSLTAGEAIVPGKSTSSQGSYYVSDPASRTVVWPVASAQPRIDALVLAVGDTQYGVVGAALGGDSGPEVIVVQGTPNASPVAPSDDAITTAVGAGGWVRLYNVRINNGDTTINPANITDTDTGVYDTDPVVSRVTATPTMLVPGSPGSATRAYDTNFTIPANADIKAAYIRQDVRFNAGANAAITCIMLAGVNVDGNVQIDLVRAHNHNEVGGWDLQGCGSGYIWIPAAVAAAGGTLNVHFDCTPDAGGAAMANTGQVYTRVDFLRSI